jgi:hypothetical protein
MPERYNNNKIKLLCLFIKKVLFFFLIARKGQSIRITVIGKEVRGEEVGEIK